jgi:hypothetical protein
MFVDAFAMGEDSTDATRAAEWANTGEFYKNGNSRITWIFTAPNNTTQWKIKNNYYCISDSGQAFLKDYKFGEASPLSWHINSRLGADSVKAFTKTTLTLNKIPKLMTNMMRWYESPTGGNRKKDQTNFVKARDDYDRRFIEFYRDTLSCAYSTSAVAYQAAEGGYPVGDLNWFPTAKAAWEKTSSSAVRHDNNSTVEQFDLWQNYPNPFNPSTSISYTLKSAEEVNLSIYNALGQKVRTLVAQKQSAGSYAYKWDGKDDAGYAMSGGLYLYQIKVGQVTSVKKMMYLK